MINGRVDSAVGKLLLVANFMFIVNGCFDDGENAKPCSLDSDCSSEQLCYDEFCTEGIRPAVLNQSPLPNATGVAVLEPITLDFNTSMDTELTESNLIITQGEEPAAGTIAWINGGERLVFTPENGWNYNSVSNVRLKVGAKSKRGYPLSVPVSFEFTTDIPRASIVETYPADGATNLGNVPLLSFQFSEPMLPESKSEVTLTDSSGEQAVAVTAYWNENGTILFLWPAASLVAGDTYILTAPKDLAAESGNPLDAEYSVSFNIGTYSDEVAPSLSIDSIDGSVVVADLINNAQAFSGSVSDDSGVEWVGVEVVAEGDSPQGEWLRATVTGTSWSHNWNAALLDPLPQGIYDVYVRAVDGAGNAVEESLSLEMDIRPPVAPTFPTALPASWKFKTLPISVMAEDGSTLGITQDGAPIAGSPFAVGNTEVALSLTLPDIGLSTTLEFLVTDAAGNASLETVTQVVQRAGYSCLSGSNGFPVAGVEVDSLVDDEEGNVQITYRLGEGAVEDTYINTSGGTGTNHGIEQYIGVGMSPDNKWLMKLPNTFFPTCAAISFAEIRYQIQPSSCENCPLPTTLDAYVILKDWDEREVTWAEASLGDSWQDSGASGALDVEALPIGLMAEEESGQVFSMVLTSLAQLWANATDGTEPMKENRGLLFYPSESGTRTIYSSETPTSELRPTLELNFVESP